MENSLNNQASEIGKYFSYSHIHNCKEELDAGHFKGLRDKPFRVKAQASFLNSDWCPQIDSDLRFLFPKYLLWTFKKTHHPWFR